MSEFLSKPIKIPHVSRPISEAELVGSERFLPHGEVTRRSSYVSPTVLTDGRRLGEGIGFQTSYLSLLPDGTTVDVFWAGRNADRVTSGNALQRILPEKALPRNIILLTGGEHLHPETTGTQREADSHKLREYGEPDMARDTVGLALLDHAEVSNSPTILICRGSQLAIHYYSNGYAIPGDHDQDHHDKILTPDGVILKQHGVTDIFPDELRKIVGVQLPIVGEVNSAHAQGYRLRDISGVAMEKLNANGWYPWLLANIPEVDPRDQTYEGWLRIQDGRISGVMAQFHPEVQDDMHGDAVRRFIREVTLANLKVPNDKGSEEELF
jgi:hypothetical protein